MAKFDYFISHHQADAGAEASLLAETLRNEGYRVFLDVDTHVAGDVSGLTRRSLEDSRGVILLIGSAFSERVSERADWVKAEISLANKLGKKIVPVYLSPESRLTSRNLPPDLSFLPRLRSLNFDRARILTLVEELRESFGFRSRSARGAPSLSFQLILVLLSVSLGVVLFRENALESELKQERARRESAERERQDEVHRREELRKQLDDWERDYRDQVRAGGLVTRGGGEERSHRR
ncbi:MAG TPA: toll/interleukin-1 receptor domain-containing protein [Polyangia bacterium]|nr:toll/interleukin-1 receptor domain-containing protein [Polyangia bacterium]